MQRQEDQVELEEPEMPSLDEYLRDEALEFLNNTERKNENNNQIVDQDTQPKLNSV